MLPMHARNACAGFDGVVPRASAGDIGGLEDFKAVERIIVRLGCDFHIAARASVVHAIFVAWHSGVNHFALGC